MDIQAGGVQLFYLDEGPRDGMPVVFIHGFPFNHTMWKPQIDLLSKRVRVIAVDVRGHGKSGAGDGQYTVDLFVDDLWAVLDAAGVKKAVLVGLSMGGYIALRAAQRDPERVAALALCDTKSEADGNDAKIRRAQSMLRVKKEGTRVFADEFVKTVLTRETIEKNPRIAELVREMIRGNTPLGVAGTLLALAARTDTTAALPELGLPAVVIVGEKDVLTPVSSSSVMAEKLRNSELAVIRDAAHLSNLENPGAFNAALEPFLDKVRKTFV